MANAYSKVLGAKTRIVRIFKHKGYATVLTYIQIVSAYKINMNKGFVKISNEDIRKSLENVTRQYFVGNLKKSQSLDFIKREDIEIGITSYKEYSEEQPHYHTVVTEFQYVVSGWTKYINLKTKEEFEFKMGDFYVIETGTHYAQKSKKGTKILFIKSPSINDKMSIEYGDDIVSWYTEGLKGIRVDYSHENDMPNANSVCPASAVAIIKNNKILMLKRKDNGMWTLPGGTMEMEESISDCAIRELKEETNLNIQIEDVIGIYTDPKVRIEYSDGEVRREFTIGNFY